MPIFAYRVVVNVLLFSDFQIISGLKSSVGYLGLPVNGILSGACTFGFIAPILAIITVQAEIAKGLSLILVFALGHCLPIVIAGSSAALAQRLLAGKGMQTATVWGRKIAGGLVVLVGVYLIYTGLAT